MSWFRLDDKSWGHPKVVSAGNAAWGALCRMGAWSSDHLTDGAIPAPIASLIGSVDDVTKLVDVGLLERHPDGSYRIHDFLDRNPSAKAVGKLRKDRAKAGALGAHRTNSTRAANGRASAASTASASADAFAGVVPTTGTLHVDGKRSAKVRPDPVPSPDPSSGGSDTPSRTPGGGESRKRAHRLPKDWNPPEALLAELRTKLGVEPLGSLDDFRDWAASSPKAIKVDWEATFRGWVRRDAKDGKLEAWSPPAPPSAPVVATKPKPEDLAPLLALAEKQEREGVKNLDVGEGSDVWKAGSR